MKEKEGPDHSLWHRIVYKAVYPLTVLLLKKYQFTTDVCPKLNDGHYIIMANHTTESDMTMLINAFRQHMYFVCGEHLKRSKVAKPYWFFFDPIPEFKGTVPLGTVREILRRAHKGHNIMIFPEGSRSFNGVTAKVDVSAGKLVKHAKAGLITYRIIGGYFVAPRWAYHFRTGKLQGKIMHIIKPEEIAKMTDEEVTDIINTDLHEDAYETQKKLMNPYVGEGLAEGIENYLIHCPNCLAYDSMKGEGNEFHCVRCGKKATLDEYGFIHGDFPYDNVRDFGAWVVDSFKEEMRGKADDEHLFTETDVKLFQITRDHKQIDLMSGTAELYKDRIEMGDYKFPYAEMPAMSGLYYGKTALFTHDNTFYGLTGEHCHAWKCNMLYDLVKEKESVKA